MKAMILIVATCLSTSLHAMDFAVQKNLETQLEVLFRSEGIIMTGRSIFAPTDPSTPVRQAKLSVRIQKNVAVTMPDGKFYYQASDVCIQSTSINVYDIRAHGGGLEKGDFNLVSCASTYLGQPITVNIGGAVAIASRKLFTNKVEDFESAYPVLWYQSQAEGIALPAPRSSFVGSAGLKNNSSMLTFIQPINLTTCPSPNSCKPAVTEFFSAIVEVID